MVFTFFTRVYALLLVHFLCTEARWSLARDPVLGMQCDHWPKALKITFSDTMVADGALIVARKNPFEQLYVQYCIV